jgi:tetratricopeptide (TPR) repeat protein
MRANPHEICCKRAGLLLGCAIWLSSPPCAAGAQARPLAQSAELYRLARAPRAASVRTHVLRAERHLAIGLRALPSGFRSICERTYELRLSAESPAVRSGRSRALGVFWQQGVQRRDALDAALRELELARGIAPRDPDVARLRAQILVLWEEPASIERCEVAQRTRAAIQALREWHELRPELASSASWGELGALFARDGEYVNAAIAYRRALALALDAGERSTAYAQLAQATMLAGDAAAALPYYQRALASAEPGRTSALLRLGLAVALDRLGEHARAIEQAVQGVSAVERSLDWLGPESMSFEPASERFVYRALAHEAIAELMPEARALSLEAAAESYAAFLARAGESHLYRNAAEADLRAVVEQLQASP